LGSNQAKLVLILDHEVEKIKKLVNYTLNWPYNI